jgi:glucose-1-phosphate cytidylyltransferase
MRVGILAGGHGTRLAEETESKPKPLVEIGDKSILWHIMKHYHHFGFSDFVIALGYKGDFIKRFINNNFPTGTSRRKARAEDALSDKMDGGESWMVELVDTGQDTETGGRIKHLKPYLDSGTFMLTWADGLSNVNISDLVAFHRSHGRLATVTAVKPPPRFGKLDIRGNAVVSYSEKPQPGDEWINGGFFVLEPGVFDYIEGYGTQWEREPLERLAKDGQLMAFRHEGFWQCMDTLWDRNLLQDLWQQGNPPWKVWE